MVQGMFIPMLEEVGCIVFTCATDILVIENPKGKSITFSRDMGVCADMHYIDLCTNSEGPTMLETIQKKHFEGAPNHGIKNVYYSCTAQKEVLGTI
jgi:hypothetical protein